MTERILAGDSGAARMKPADLIAARADLARNLGWLHVETGPTGTGLFGLSPTSTNPGEILKVPDWNTCGKAATKLLRQLSEMEFRIELKSEGGIVSCLLSHRLIDPVYEHTAYRFDEDPWTILTEAAIVATDRLNNIGIQPENYHVYKMLEDEAKTGKIHPFARQNFILTQSRKTGPVHAMRPETTGVSVDRADTLKRQTLCGYFLHLRNLETMPGPVTCKSCLASGRANEIDLAAYDPPKTLPLMTLKEWCQHRQKVFDRRH